MRGERGQQHEPPRTKWCKQKRCNQNRIRRPENGYRMRLKRQRETDFAPKIISGEYPQPDHQTMPVKNRTSTVRARYCRSNVRSFEEEGSPFHLFGKRSAALCQGGDSNPYGFLHQILSLARLPIPPPRQILELTNVALLAALANCA